jgi:hypothetical protein
MASSNALFITLHFVFFNPMVSSHCHSFEPVLDAEPRGVHSADEISRYNITPWQPMYLRYLQQRKNKENHVSPCTSGTYSREKKIRKREYLSAHRLGAEKQQVPE